MLSDISLVSSSEFDPHQLIYTRPDIKYPNKARLILSTILRNSIALKTYNVLVLLNNVQVVFLRLLKALTQAYARNAYFSASDAEDIKVVNWFLFLRFFFCVLIRPYRFPDKSQDPMMLCPCFLMIVFESTMDFLWGHHSPLVNDEFLEQKTPCKYNNPCSPHNLHNIFETYITASTHVALNQSITSFFSDKIVTIHFQNCTEATQVECFG